jgi:hypothetical protein
MNQQIYNINVPDFIRRELSALIGLQIFKVPTLGGNIELNQITLKKT